MFVPRTIKEALDNPSWKLAVKEEMNALDECCRMQMGIYSKVKS